MAAFDALILAAGYGTRLAKGIKSDISGDYKHLLGVPKPLLPIGGTPLISRWVNDLIDIPECKTIYVVTNAYNHSMFEAWAKQYQGATPVKLVCDGSTCNEDRSGAVAAIELCIRSFNVTNNLLVVGGDTLFLQDFDTQTTITAFMDAYQRKDAKASMLLAYQTDDVGASKCGILETDSNSKVTAFLEKPGPQATTSRQACPCFYMFAPAALPLVAQFMQDKADRPLKERDAPGNFVRYLSAKMPCYVMPISGRWDVGGLQSYIDCNNAFTKASSLGAVLATVGLAVLLHSAKA